MNQSQKEVEQQCKEVLNAFKKNRKKTSLVCLYEYSDLDFQYPCFLLAMEKNDQNEANLFELIGRLTKEQNDLPSDCRKAYLIQYEVLVK
jgi:hypothetical protein